MKKLALLVVLSAAFVLMSGVAMAAETPHGPFNANTAVCAACHRAHTSSAEYLLAAPKATGLCLQCHGNGATGADTDVYGGNYVVNGTEARWAPNPSGYDHADWGLATSALLGGGFITSGRPNAVSTSMHMDPTNNAALTGFQVQFGSALGTTPGTPKAMLDCVDCHMPHNSPNYRMLRMKPTGSAIDLYVPSKKITSSSASLTGAPRTTVAARVLSGTVNMPATSALVANTILKAGSKVVNEADRTAIGGSYNAVFMLTADRTSPARTLSGDVFCAIGSTLPIGTTLAVGSASSDTADQTVIAGTWTPGYSAANPGRRYTEDQGMFNTQVNNPTAGATYDGISKWCGIGCHAFYYRGAIRVDKPLVAMSTRLATSYFAGGQMSIAVDSVAGIAINTVLVINGGSYTVVAPAPTTAAVNLSRALEYSPGVPPSGVNVVTMGTIVAISGQGMELYYDLNNDGTVDSNYMHAIDVDLMYSPRNGNTPNQNLSAYLTTPLGNALGTNKLPVADQNNNMAYDSGDFLTCLTCHRAHGSEATMNQADARIGQLTTVNGAITTSTTAVTVADAAGINNLDKIGFLTANSQKAVNGTVYTVQSKVGNTLTVAPAVNGNVINIPNGAIVTDRIIGSKIFPSAANSMLLRLENRAVCQQCHMMPSGF